MLLCRQANMHLAYLERVSTKTLVLAALYMRVSQENQTFRFIGDSAQLIEHL